MIYHNMLKSWVSAPTTSSAQTSHITLSVNLTKLSWSHRGALGDTAWQQTLLIQFLAATSADDGYDMAHDNESFAYWITSVMNPEGKFLLFVSSQITNSMKVGQGCPLLNNCCQV